MKKATRSEEQGSHSHGKITTSTSASPADLLANAPTKIARVLEHLTCSGSLNRFEAERIGDHCLPSTIAVLAHDHGLLIQRQSERVPNRWGAPCTVTRYSLPPSQHKRARALLAYLTRKPKKVAA